FNREYLVQSLHVHLESNALQSGPAREGRGLLRSSIVAHDLASPFQPALRTAKPVMNGIQTATVVGTAGNTVETDGENYGSVKVKFPWDRSADKVGANSCWVRVSQAWAGTGSGAVFPPRIGQEVLVAFLEGDPDRPIVVGRVSNNDNMHPYGGSQTRSGIRSHTFGGGPENFNELRFDDEKGREELFIQAEKTMTTRVKGDQDVTVKGASVLRVNE